MLRGEVIKVWNNTKLKVQKTIQWLEKDKLVVLSTPEINNLRREKENKWTILSSLEQKRTGSQGIRVFLSPTDELRRSKLIEEIDDLQRKLDFQEKVSNNSEWGLNFKDVFEHEQRAKEFYQQSKDLHEQCSRLNDKLNWLRSLVRAGDLTQLQSLVRGGKI